MTAQRLGLRIHEVPVRLGGRHRLAGRGPRQRRRLRGVRRARPGVVRADPLGHGPRHRRYSERGGPREHPRDAPDRVGGLRRRAPAIRRRGSSSHLGLRRALRRLPQRTGQLRRQHASPSGSAAWPTPPPTGAWSVRPGSSRPVGFGGWARRRCWRSAWASPPWLWPPPGLPGSTSIVPELFALTIANLAAAFIRFAILRTWVFRPDFGTESEPGCMRRPAPPPPGTRYPRRPTRRPDDVRQRPHR